MEQRVQPRAQEPSVETGVGEPGRERKEVLLGLGLWSPLGGARAPRERGGGEGGWLCGAQSPERPVHSAVLILNRRAVGSQ